MKLIVNFLFALLIFAPLASFGVPAVPAAGAVTLIGHFIKQPAGSLLMAVNVEVWKRDIIGNLFKANPFLNYAFNADDYVIGGQVVHIPTAGSKPGAKKNRTDLPAAVKLRNDTDIVYLIDEFTTDPLLIPHADTVELSYDKRQSVLSEHQEKLNELVADWMIYNWFTYTYSGTTHTGHILRTTGSSIAAHLSTATGNRKKFVKEDLKAAQTYMNTQNIAKEGRYALVDSEMYDQLLDDSDLKQRDGANGGEVNLKEGVVMKLYGFNILERSSVLRFTNAGTPVAKDPDATEAADDNAAVLCWQQNSVERAKGSTEFFENEGDPTYYGDIYSALVRCGGRQRRSEGVVAIVQEAV